MTGFFQVVDNSPTPPLSSVESTFDISLQHFQLGETRLSEDRTRTPKGILTSGAGWIECQAGAVTELMNLRLEVFLEEPRHTADYADLVEVSYYSASDEFGLFTRPDGRFTRLLALPKSGTSYRVRYGRDRPELVPSSTEARYRERALLQIWPAPAREPAELKVTSSTGLFWHPLYAFRNALRGDDV